MKNGCKKYFVGGAAFLTAFALWSFLVKSVDLKAIGPQNTSVGLARFNGWFHSLTGVNMSLYYLTDRLGLVPVSVVLLFAAVGLVQLIKRRSLFRVDRDILCLGVYYIIVFAGYLAFEMIPINYRPILINGVLEASYPSSTTLLVLSVMPTLCFEAKRRLKNRNAVKIICVFSVLFSAFTVIARLVSGVHWITDIIGAMLLSGGSFLLFISAVLRFGGDV